MRIYDLPYMKQYITWRCDRCNAIFKFDTDIAPLRCPDCLSPKEHLHQESNEYLFGKKIVKGTLMIPMLSNDLMRNTTTCHGWCC